MVLDLISVVFLSAFSSLRFMNTAVMAESVSELQKVEYLALDDAERPEFLGSNGQTQAHHGGLTVSTRFLRMEILFSGFFV